MRHLWIDGQESGRLSRRANAADALFNNPLHFRMTGVIRVAQRGRQVRRADKDAVNPLDFKDRIQIIEGGFALSLE